MDGEKIFVNEYGKEQYLSIVIMISIYSPVIIPSKE